MIPRLLASGALLLGMLSLPARAAQDTVVVYPPDLTLTSEGTVKVFAFRQEKGAPDNVTVNGVPAPPLGGETFLKGEAKLFPGLNVLQVGGRTVRLFFLDRPAEMLAIYSNLHQNVQDEFNEHGVQIMSPHYMADPAGAKVVPKQQWFAAPAQPPSVISD